MNIGLFRRDRKPPIDGSVQTAQDRYEWERSEAHDSLREWENVLTDMVLGSEDHKMRIHGYCDACGKKVDFLLDDLYREFSNFDTFNDFDSTGGLCFRERMVCPECGLNSRQRALIGMLPDYADRHSRIYMQEQITPPFRAVSAKYPDVIGSEYLGEGLESGFVDENGIRHEDATRLSFPDGSFDCVISQDVFEHVFDIDACLKEMYRVIRPGGRLIISVPFYTSESKTRVRARMKDGEIEYVMKPIYHGNPMGGGSLLVYDYGWDLLDWIQDAGFSKAYVRKVYSPEHGIIGVDTVRFIIAER